MLVSGMMYGLAVVLFTASPWFGLSLTAMAIADLFHVHTNILVQTVVQTYSPPEFRGRTMALFSINRAMITIGVMLFGPLASLAGPRWAVTIMGAAGSLSMVALHFTVPRARHIR